MVKKTIKIYLESQEETSLKNKAEAMGFSGRGAISKYIQKISNNDIIFLDDNLKSFAGMLKIN